MPNILVTRPWVDSIDLARIIWADGHSPIVFPTVDIVPPEVSPDWTVLHEKIEQSRLCIFLSANAVTFIPIEIKNLLQTQKNIFSMGEKTAESLHHMGIASFVVGKEGMTSEKLIETPLISSLAADDQVIIFAGKGGRVIMQDYLTAHQINVTRIETYERRCPVYTKSEINLVFGIGYMPDVMMATSQLLLDNTYQMCQDITFLPLVVPSQRIKDYARQTLKWSGKIVVADSATNSAMWAATKTLFVRLKT